jgi:Domain of unknown function (DUF4349)
MRANRVSIKQLVLLLVAIVVIVGCAGGASQQLSTVGNAIPAGGDEGGGRSAASAAPAAPDEPGTPDQVGNLIDDAKIVRTGSMELEVADVPAALLTARDGIRAMGGYIGASETQTVDDRPVATNTYRIPVDRWEDALDLMRGIAGDAKNVLNERTQAVEVTGAIVDLEARIRNLRASEVALQEISSRAARVSDVLEVQAQLTTVRGQIEQLTAQLTQLDDQASYATLDVTFSMPLVAVEVAAKGWEPSVVVDEASASLVNILQALTTAGIWFAIVWLPLLVAFGILAFIVIAILRRFGYTGPGGRRPSDAATAG